MPPLLRWPRRWPRPRVSLVVAWAVALIFIWQWIWAYDACRVADEFGGSRFLCLAATFYAQLLTWAAAFWLTLITLIERIFP
jgi:hypothetical protein